MPAARREGRDLASALGLGLPWALLALVVLGAYAALDGAGPAGVSAGRVLAASALVSTGAIGLGAPLASRLAVLAASRPRLRAAIGLIAAVPIVSWGLVAGALCAGLPLERGAVRWALAIGVSSIALVPRLAAELGGSIAAAPRSLIEAAIALGARPSAALRLALAGDVGPRRAIAMAVCAALGDGVVLAAAFAATGLAVSAAPPTAGLVLLAPLGAGPGALVASLLVIITAAAAAAGGAARLRRPRGAVPMELVEPIRLSSPEARR